MSNMDCCSGGSIFPFHARLDSISTDMGSSIGGGKYKYHFILADGSEGTTAKGGHKLFRTLIGDL